VVPTFEEKNFLRNPSHETSLTSQARHKPVSRQPLTHVPATSSTTSTTTAAAANAKKLTSLRRKSMASNGTTVSKKSSLVSTYDTLEQEIKQLQMRTQLDLPLMQQQHERLLQEQRRASITSVNQIDLGEDGEPPAKNTSLQSRLANIGKLDAKKNLAPPHRSSTPDAAKTSNATTAELHKLHAKLEK
jgi:hypothetical protein